MTQSHPAHSDPTASTAPISAGTLFYLWGDRLLEPAGALGSTVLPSGAKVSAKQLASLVCAVSFARLQADGALHLEVVSKKSLGMFKQDHVQVTPAAHPGVRGGYEDAIVGRVSAGAGTAYDVVRGWYSHDVAFPEGNIFAIAEQEMVTAGLGVLDEAGSKGMKAMLRGRAKVTPLPDRITATWDQFQYMQAGWNSLGQNNPALQSTLLETCLKAVRSRQETD